jgi:tRNA pseudouridine13 synthase
MFGHKLKAAAGEAAARESRLLAAEGLTLADFERGGGEAEGTRRAARLCVEVALAPLAEGYRATFQLPKGAYATVVMRELMKAEADLPDDEAP